MIVIVIVVVIMVAIAAPATIAAVIPALVTIAVVAVVGSHDDAVLDVRPRIDRDGGWRDDDLPRRCVRRRRRTVVRFVDRRCDDAPTETERQTDERAERSNTMNGASHEPSLSGIAEARRS